MAECVRGCSVKYDILGLLPPTNADASLDRWQRAITATVLIVVALLVSSNAVLGAALYQALQEQTAISQKIDKLGVELKTGDLFTRIMMMRTRYCEALQKGLDVERASWDREIFRALAEYQRLTSQPFPMFNPC